MPIAPAAAATASSSEPATLSVLRSDGSSVLELYRATLGPLHTDFYLRVFTQFDAAGKPAPSWNWSAALLSVNWLLYRRLWLHLLGYAGAQAATMLLLVGIGRLVFALDGALLWTLLVLAQVVAVALPGAYGNSWLYAASNKRMEAALAGNDNGEQACAELARKAPNRRQLSALAVVNLALAGLLGTLALLWPDSGANPMPGSQTEMAHEASAPTQQSGLATQSVAAAAAAGLAAASAPAPKAAASQAAAPLASQSPAAQASPLPVPAPASAPAATVAPTPAPPRVSQGRVQDASLPPVVAASAAPAAPAATKASAEKVATPTKAERRALAGLAKKEKAAKAAQAKASAPTPAAPAPASAASAAGAESGRYMVNVGLFANPDNASKAYTKLQEAGLPASSSVLMSAKGARTRVRVGPFENQAEADSAAEKIRTLHLDAAVVKP